MTDQLLHPGLQHDIAEHAIYSLDSIAKNISEAVGDPECYLHQAIVDAVYRGIRDGIREQMEQKK